MDRIEKILVFVVVATIVVIVTIALTTGGPGETDESEAAKSANASDRGVDGSANGSAAVGGPTGGTDAGTSDGGAGYGDATGGALKGDGLEGDHADLDSPVVRDGGSENASGSDGRAAAGGGGRPTNPPSATPGGIPSGPESGRHGGVSGRSGSEGTVPNASTVRRGSGIDNDPAPIDARGIGKGRVASNAVPNWLDPGATGEPAATSYVVRKDDSYWKIAERVYGDGKYFKRLVDANLDVPASRMRPGMTIVVPAFESKAKATIKPSLVTHGTKPDAGRKPDAAKSGVRVIRLGKGQTVYGLLRENKMERKFREVLALNGLTEAAATDLAVGHPIKLPVR